jgi:HSP20 family molecular chaperone IbpA
MTYQFLSQRGVQFVSGVLAYAPTKWQPAVDIHRCVGGWLLKFELAGVCPEELEITADSRGITVSGIRRDLRHFESQETHLMEIAYSHFGRYVEFPEQITDARLRVEYRDGMLYVQVLTSEKREHV